MTRKRVLGVAAATAFGWFAVAGCSALDGLKDVPPITDGSVAGDSGRSPNETGTTEAGADSSGTEDSGDSGGFEDTGMQEDVVVDSSPGPDAHDAGPVYTAAPRPISPLSTSHVTSQTPKLTWELPAGVTQATVDLCATPSCSSPTSTLVIAGATTFTPTSSLSAGLHFWRLHPGSDTSLSSPVWEFTVGALTAMSSGAPGPNTSWGTTLDLYGTGCADLVVGGDDDLSGGVGYAAIYKGNPNGIAAGSAPDKLLKGPSGTYFGYAVASAGDLNGDGYGDLVVGGYGANNDTGNIYIFLGSSSGPAMSPDLTLVGPDGAAGTFGTSVAGGGDLNSDGYGDLIVGAPGANSGGGKTYIYYGGPNLGGDAGTGLTAGPILKGPVASSFFGTSVASAGDVNGDGVPDVVIGAYGANEAYLYSGKNLATNPVILSNPGGANDFFGHSVSGVGDVNADGYADVLVGAYGLSNSKGTAYIFMGSSGGLAVTPVAIANPSTSTASQFGVAISGAGDVNGDGYADVVIGADGANAGNGGAYLFLGGPTGLATAPTNLTYSVPAGAPASGFYGSAVAGTGNLNCGVYSGIAGGGSNDYTGEAYFYTGGSNGLPDYPTNLPPPVSGMTSFGIAMFGTTN